MKAKYKKIFLILIISFIFLFCSCENNSSVTTEQYKVTYSSIGNGKITSETENNATLLKGSYFSLMASAFEDESFIGWLVNGNDYGSKTVLILEAIENYQIVAQFTQNKKEIDDTYHTNFLYAYLPEEWEQVNVVLMVNKTIKKLSMEQSKNNIWQVDLESEGINLDGITSLYFMSGNEKSKEYEFDSEFNYFSYSGFDKNGKLNGGFSNKKVESCMKLSILELNDLHGYIVQSSEGKAGISNASYFINQVRDEDELDNVVLVANGDMFQGTALSNLSFGESVLNCMNEMQFDFMGIGNHEFDWGLEKIINYFDGNPSNGEANFPLVNSNIQDKNTGSLLTDQNILTTYLFEKEGLKIGVISMIGDLTSSILYSRVKDYQFLGTSLCEKQAKELKEQGADIIIANIHGGESSGVLNYAFNTEVANLKDNGEWLIDCIINGHTHTNQTGKVSRLGQDCPIVQGGSYCYYIGEIDLYIDKETKEVLTSDVYTNSIYDVDTNYDEKIEKIVSEEYKKVQTEMEETYCIAECDITNKSNLKDWTGNVIVASTGCICGICNTSGLRSTGNIKKNGDIKLENVYLINPFDDELIIVTISGKELCQFLEKTRSVFYSFKEGYSLSSLRNDNTKYEVAVIDYVYYWDSFPKGENDIFTGLILRDCMIQDLKCRETFNPISDSEAKVGKLIQ